MKLTLPTRIIGSGGGLAETASLPDFRRPFTYSILDIEGEQVRTVGLDSQWGFEKWQHTPNLYPNNDCGCDRCKGIGNDWSFGLTDWLDSFRIQFMRTYQRFLSRSALVEALRGLDL